MFNDILLDRAMDPRLVNGMGGVPSIIDTLSRLINAAEPFTSGNVVDETSGTLPLMKELSSAIAQARLHLMHNAEGA